MTPAPALPGPPGRAAPGRELGELLGVAPCLPTAQCWYGGAAVWIDAEALAQAAGITGEFDPHTSRLSMH